MAYFILCFENSTKYYWIFERTLLKHSEITNPQASDFYLHPDRKRPEQKLQYSPDAIYLGFGKKSLEKQEVYGTLFLKWIDDLTTTEVDWFTNRVDSFWFFSCFFQTFWCEI